MKFNDVDKLLKQAVPHTSEGADLLLDLRVLLINDGHPGSCVQCFISLLGSLDRPGGLTPLRHWFESHIQVAVHINGETVEYFPVRFGQSKDLVDYCNKTITMMREDRTYSAKQIRLSFEYVATAA